MRGRLIAVAATGLVALSATASARAVLLVGPRGQPVGGRWQAWANRAKVPTYRGTITLRIDDCPGLAQPVACTSPVYLNGKIVSFEIDVPSADPRADYTWSQVHETFLHELGQAFDEAYLTPRDLYSFARIWRERPTAPIIGWWWKNEPLVSSSPIGDSYLVPGEQFAEGYQFCALYGQDWSMTTADNETFEFGYPASYSAVGSSERLQRWSIGSQRATCRVIAKRFRRATKAEKRMKAYR